MGKGNYAVLCFVVFLSAAVIFGGESLSAPGIAKESYEMEQEHLIQQAAWITSLCPRTVLEHAMRLVEADATAGEQDEIPVKIKWKCLELFQDMGQQRKGLKWDR